MTSNSPTTRPEVKPSDSQVGGNHYAGRFAIEPIEFILKNDLPAGPASIVRYVCRYRNKNGAEDLMKARHYIDLMLEYEYGITP